MHLVEPAQPVGQAGQQQNHRQPGGDRGQMRHAVRRRPDGVPNHVRGKPTRPVTTRSQIRKTSPSFWPCRRYIRVCHLSGAGLSCRVKCHAGVGHVTGVESWVRACNQPRPDRSSSMRRPFSLLAVVQAVRVPCRRPGHGLLQHFSTGFVDARFAIGRESFGSTSSSLLARARPHDAAAWQRLVQL